LWQKQDLARLRSTGDRFKATAVKLSKLSGVSVQDVAAAAIPTYGYLAISVLA